MSEIIKLPSGNTATMRDAKELKYKDRKTIWARANNLEGMLQVMALTEGVIAALIQEWSFDLLIPSLRIQSLEELDFADIDFLMEYANNAQGVFSSSTEKTLETEADPKADTANSND